MASKRGRAAKPEDRLLSTGRGPTLAAGNPNGGLDASVAGVGRRGTGRKGANLVFNPITGKWTKPAGATPSSPSRPVVLGNGSLKPPKGGIRGILPPGPR